MLTSSEAIKEIEKMQEQLAYALEKTKKMRMRQSERAMTIAALEKRRTALRMAVNALKRLPANDNSTA